MSLWARDSKKQVLYATALVVCFAFLATLFVVFFSFDIASAQVQTTEEVLDQVEQDINLGRTNVILVIIKIIRVLLGLLGLLAVSITIYAGFLIMTSAGNEEKVEKGKRTLINGAIGLFIIFFSFAIVQFIINRLEDIVGFGSSGDPSISGPAFNTFAGSGGLGHVIRDHYPFRDAEGVSRNTKIVVTFNEAIDPSSIIDNTNGDDIVGNCIPDSPDSVTFNCDQLNLDAVQIFANDDEEKVALGATAQALYDSVDEAYYTFVFQPIDPLGDNAEDMWYTVNLTNDIEKVDGSGAFDTTFSGRYFWEFQTNTTFDYSPPYVEDTYPRDGWVIPRNSVLQLHFNEAVDPMVLQGSVGPGGVFSTIIFDDAAITGQWKITNGYRTVEFVSNEACGQNSCGETMYCLPVSCADPTDETCETPRTILVHTAELLVEDPPAESKTAFVAIPFSGAMDMAGNGMDGNEDDVADDRPDSVDDSVIHLDTDLAPDNFWWDFRIQNKIDRTLPYVSKVAPGIDQEGVRGNEPLQILFSKTMWQDSMSKGIGVDEFPKNVGGIDDLAFVVRSTMQDDGSTRANIVHREFGPNGLDLYYFPKINSTVKATNQNCMYPGIGPDSDDPTFAGEPVCEIEYDEFDNVISYGDGCIDITLESGGDDDTACVATSLTNAEKTQKDIASCITTLEHPDNSPI